MYRTRFLIGAVALSCAAVFTGCVDTAPNQLSEMEQNWARVIGESYPGHRIPKTMPPAVRGSLIVEEGVQSADTAAPAAPAADADPASMVDKAAASTPAEDVAPEPKEQPAPVVKEEKAAAPAKAEDKKADKPAAAPAVEEKKADKPAAAPAVEEKKADKPANQSAEAVVKAGDTLTGLAKEFYGDAKYYDVILKANPQIKNPKSLKIGTKLVIPAL